MPPAESTPCALLIDEQVIDLADLFANRVEYVPPLDAFGSIH
jgi:hypothetical protein